MQFYRGFTGLFLSALCCLAGFTMPALAMSTPPIYRLADVQQLTAGINQATTVQEVTSSVQSLLDQYSLKLTTTCMQDAAFTCQSVVPGDLPTYKRMAVMFVEEWAKYPPEWTRATDLQTINLINKYEYRYNGTSQARAAAPMNYLRAMIYDISYSYDEAYMRHVIHHEYAHYFEASYYGDVYHHDARWAAFNPAEFSYGGGGGTCYEEGNTCLTGVHPAPGFVTGYATSGMEEDKAELYGYMFTTAGYAQLAEWAKTDAILANKLAYYKRVIRAVVPQMDDEYFAKIHSGVAQAELVPEPQSTVVPDNPGQEVPDDGLPTLLVGLVVLFMVFVVGSSVIVGICLLIWWLVRRNRTPSHEKAPR